MILSQPLNRLIVYVALLSPISIIAQEPPSPPTADLQQLKALVSQGHLDEAKAMALKEIQQSPSLDTYNFLGIINSQLQDYPNALDAFHHALQLAPHSIQTHNNLGNLYLTEKQLDLAEKEFLIVLQLDPRNQDANYNQGILLMTKGSPAEAIHYFDRIHPPTIETRFSLIRAYLQTNRISEALTLVTQLSSEKREDVQVHFSLGVLLASAKQFKAAQFELEQAEALKPGTFEILFNLGQACLRNNNNQGAELALSQALKLEPTSPETLYLLAQVYSNESRQLDALDLLVRANRLQPDNPDVLYLMAQISISQKFFEDAIPLLERALQLVPDRLDLLALLGESYFKSDKIDKAIVEFTRLVQLQPSVRAYSFLGLSYTYLGRFNEAKQNFHDALRLDPRSNFCLFQLGYIARMQGDSTGAETIFRTVLRSDPNYPNALLELANVRIDHKQFGEAADLLKRYIRVDKDSATGYYKLAMVEKNLHRTDAAAHDLAEFQSLSKDTNVSSHPYDNLFDYLDSRSKLSTPAKIQLDITDLSNQLKTHPDQSEILYALAEDYLKAGKLDDARATIAQLESTHLGDSQILTNDGVLLARYRAYDNAIQHFQAALQTNPHMDDASFDLADAYFHKGLYSNALDAALQVSLEGRKSNSFLDLLGDIYAHLGDNVRAEALYKSAIARNPDNDQDYLSLALIEFRKQDIAAAKDILVKGQERIPGSGKIVWGMGLASAFEGNTPEAARQFERAVEILPQWPGAYSTLGVFYYETGQIAKAKEVLERFKNNSSQGGLNVNRIEATLAQTSASATLGNEPLSEANKTQLLQFALFVADRTL